MPILGTFNGWNIIGMPSTPAAPRSIEWTAQDTVATSISPFTGQTQVMDWQASWLEGSVTMPPMLDSSARAWMAFLSQLRGQACVFQIGDPLAKLPLGTATGGSVVGAGQSGYTLTVDMSGTLEPGDFIQIGYRLYRSLDGATSGTSTINIWPQIRESPADAAAIVTVGTQGLFRLKSNSRKWALSEARVYGFQFDIREAL